MTARRVATAIALVVLVNVAIVLGASWILGAHIK